MFEVTPKCPECGSNTKLKTNSKNGSKFYGCVTWKETGCNGAVGYKDDTRIINQHEGLSFFNWVVALTDSCWDKLGDKLKEIVNKKAEELPKEEAIEEYINKLEGAKGIDTKTLFIYLKNGIANELKRLTFIIDTYANWVQQLIEENNILKEYRHNRENRVKPRVIPVISVDDAIRDYTAYYGKSESGINILRKYGVDRDTIQKYMAEEQLQVARVLLFMKVDRYTKSTIENYKYHLKKFHKHLYENDVKFVE